MSREAAEKLNKETLIEILLMMQSNFDEVKKQNEALTMQLNDLNVNFKVLLEKFNVAQNARFGKSSEKMDFTEEELADIRKTIAEAPCFNEAESTVDLSNITDLEEPTLEEVRPKKRKKSKGKCAKDLECLPKAEPIISELSHEELVEQLGEGYKRMPDDVYRHLEFHPGTFEVQEYCVAVYKSAGGEQFAHAKRPTADLLQNSLASPSLVAGILNYKYVNAMPIYRLEQNFLRSDVVSDGYESYHKLEREKEGIIIAGCYAHARRRFVNAIKAMSKTSSKAEIKQTLAYKALKQMAAIYNIDTSLKDLSIEERLERRNLSVKPLVEVFFEWVRKNKDKMPPKSETGQGFSYCLNQEKYLKTFLTNGSVLIDN